MCSLVLSSVVRLLFICCSSVVRVFCRKMACPTLNEVYSLLTSIRAEQAAGRSEVAGIRADMAAARGEVSAAIARLKGLEERMELLEEAVVRGWEEEAARDVVELGSVGEVLAAVRGVASTVENGGGDTWGLVGVLWSMVVFLLGLVRSPSSALLLIYKVWYMPASWRRDLGLAVGFLLDPAAATIFVAALRLQERYTLPPQNFLLRMLYRVFRCVVGAEPEPEPAVVVAVQQQEGWGDWALSLFGVRGVGGSSSGGEQQGSVAAPAQSA
jgi:hypothetical protein